MGTRARPPLNLLPVHVQIPLFFPRLSAPGSYEETSPPTWDYNCIAWSAGKEVWVTNRQDNWWWPEPDSYWPDGATRQPVVSAFVEVFSRFGYRPCKSFDLEPGYEKVAIYVDEDGTPTHMAKQLPNGAWTSKLGPIWDITHLTLDGLNGPKPAYGIARQALRRRIDNWLLVIPRLLITSTVRFVSRMLHRSVARL